MSQRYLALCSTDELDSRPDPYSLGFGLFNDYLDRFGRDTWWQGELDYIDCLKILQVDFRTQHKTPI